VPVGSASFTMFSWALGFHRGWQHDRSRLLLRMVGQPALSHNDQWPDRGQKYLNQWF
jgi:hypothetical protein